MARAGDEVHPGDYDKRANSASFFHVKGLTILSKSTIESLPDGAGIFRDSPSQRMGIDYGARKEEILRKLIVFAD
jgi:hypothetical protein